MDSTSSITQCANCSGELTFNPAAQTLDCPFCNSTYTLKGEAIKAELVINETPQLIIPFAFAKEVFDKSAMEWLSQGDYTPADILDSFRKVVTKGVYVPLYIWGIDYVIISPTGNKSGYTVAVANSEVTKNWPGEVNEFAKSLVVTKGQTKPFDKMYTLGFDVLDDDISDTDNFNKKAQAFALESVVAANNLADIKTVVINKMELTKVYAGFWINKYTWQEQTCEVIMSGFDAAQMWGVRPVDNDAANAHSPSFKIPVLILICGIALLCLGISENGKWPASVISAISTVSILMFLFIGPIGIVINLIKRMRWKDPRQNLSKLRLQKLAERLNQHA